MSNIRPKTQFIKNLSGVKVFNVRGVNITYDLWIALRKQLIECIRRIDILWPKISMLYHIDALFLLTYANDPYYYVDYPFD